MSEKKISFKKLANGLAVIVYPLKSIPKVMTQLWYGVGSKHEKSGEKGLAHLLEHMVFKGTNKLSESDINEITNKLSGYCNAFTSYDYTGYLFGFPTQNWHYSFEILSDCMQNCKFDPEMLNSELKAVIQELKMYKDNYGASLVEKLVTNVYAGHPYQHPIIGYKHDLFDITQEKLMAFYQKHYLPNNASLVVVGDVDPEQVFVEAEKHFGHIPAKPHTVEKFNIVDDLEALEIKLFRDVKVPLVLASFKIPACTPKLVYISDLLCWIIANGRGSRLYRRLIETRLASQVSASFYDMFDGGMFFIQVQPSEDIQIIKDVIVSELYNLVENGVSKAELMRAAKQVRSGYMDSFDDLDDLASGIGRFYLATGDPEAYFKTYNTHHDNLRETLHDFLQNYFQPSWTTFGSVLPLDKNNLSHWAKIQEKSDLEDKQILDRKVRETEIEESVHAHSIIPAARTDFNFPEYTENNLDNGLTIISYRRTVSSKIEIIIELPLKHDSDPEGLEGLANITAEMILEGTTRFTHEQLVDEIESRGISLRSSAGYLTASFLKEDFEIILEILKDIIYQPLLNEASLDKIKNKIFIQLESYWDNPVQFVDQLVREVIYRGHPYRKNLLGSKESIELITVEDVKKYWQMCYNPKGAKISLVGDLPTDFLKTVSDYFADWCSVETALPVYPNLAKSHEEDILYPIKRDQVVVEFAAPSIERLHPDFDYILMFEQVLTGGALGAMSSWFFQLREQTGLFYTISGSLIAGAGSQPGMIAVKTILSLDRLEEGITAIKNLILGGAEDMSEEELRQAKDAVINSLPDYFESNEQIASTFLYLKRQGLDKDFFSKRAAKIEAIKLVEVKAAVKRLLDNNPLLTVKVGRV
jgi:zinc protease